MKENNWLDQLDAVTDFSLSKGEPQWMTNFRQVALEKANQLPLPQIERVKFHRWDLFDVNEMTEQFSETGNVPSFDTMKDNPILVQEGTTTVFEQLPMSLVEKGVIFTDLFTAMQEYPDLVQEYYMQKAVKMEEDQLTALHTAFMNSGLFLYVPKNVVINEPIESLLIQAGDLSQHFFKHILIVADEHSEFSYLERFQTTKESLQKASGNIIVEVIAKAGSKVKYSAVDQLGENVTSYINRRGHILRDTSIDWAIGVMNDGNVIADFDSDLVGEGAHAQVKIVAISSGKQTQGIDTRVTNKAPHTIGHILQHGVIREKGTLTFNGIGHILKGAKGADAQQESRVLMLSDKARGDANPILLIDENEVTAGHAASVGRVDPEEMYYLMSRGLHKEEAERLVIRGFLGSVLTAIPVAEVRKELVEVIEGKLNV
ncbi:MAG: Fe-S cluster assembly protein SufD [Enterococcus lacertideformus]|uniref:Fe-S cluster assembly protein SufD n=1 Tax=Enterococcus lacertideformus TaxID=2771493 RepID=A0A931AUT9_9ENTE|nr:Fe-S cluster assembly protein SufD [Enterococcus lacertideformus]